MSNTKISALTAAIAALSTDELPINEAGLSKKLTVGQIQAYTFGSSLPAQPAYGTNVPFFYTVPGEWYYYDGTRWLSETIFTITLSANKVLPSAIAASQTSVLEGALPNDPAGTKISMWGLVSTVRGYLSTNDGSNYWTIALATYPSTTSVGTASTNALSTGAFHVTPGIAAVIVSTDEYAYLNVTKVGSPGALDISGAVIYARRIVT